MNVMLAGIAERPVRLRRIHTAWGRVRARVSVLARVFVPRSIDRLKYKWNFVGVKEVQRGTRAAWSSAKPKL